jgi:hypothetical protein
MEWTAAMARAPSAQKRSRMRILSVGRILMGAELVACLIFADATISVVVCEMTASPAGRTGRVSEAVSAAAVTAGVEPITQSSATPVKPAHMRWVSFA